MVLHPLLNERSPERSIALNTFGIHRDGDVFSIETFDLVDFCPMMALIGCQVIGASLLNAEQETETLNQPNPQSRLVRLSVSFS